MWSHTAAGHHEDRKPDSSNLLLRSLPIYAANLSERAFTLLAALAGTAYPFRSLAHFNPMSNTPTDTSIVPAQKSAELSTLTPLAALDAYYEEKGLALMNSAEGGFSRAIQMSEAYDQLRAMLTPEVLKPIMRLQGSPLGFKTDKVYTEEVIKDALIEATIKGFYPVNNEINILAGRQYSTKEGFHGWFRRAAGKGRCSFPQWKLSAPKTVGEGALVIGTIACMWGEKKVELVGEEIPIKVNQGMGADAVLGKAERKLFARLYARCTGQVANDGDLSDGAIDISSTPAAAAQPVPALDADLLAEIEKWLKPHEEKANAFLIGNGTIQKGQTFRNVSESFARRILKQKASFLQAIGVEAGG